MGIALVHTGAAASLSLLEFSGPEEPSFSVLCLRRVDPGNIFLWPFFLATLHGMWHLGSPTMDRTHAPCLEVLCPKHWTTREVSPSLAVLSVWPSLHTLTLLSDCVCSRCLSPPKKPGLVPHPLACLPSLFLPFILGTGPSRKVWHIFFFKSHLLILENFRPKEKWTEGYNESFHTLHWIHQLQASCHIYCRLSLSLHTCIHTHTYTFCPWTITHIMTFYP